MAGNRVPGDLQRDFPGIKSGITQRRARQNQIRQNIKQSDMQNRRQNQFASLQHHVDLSTSDSRADNTTNINVNRVRNQPPIVVDKTIDFNEVIKFFDFDCFFKRTSIGTKIITDSKEKHSKCAEILKEKNIGFHSYEAIDDKVLKVFLHGLCKVDIEYLKGDLIANNINPVQIKEVITPRSSNNDALYALEFKKTDVNLSQLKNIKYVCKTAVQWKPYKKRNRGEPTQCSNCLMYGHGGKNCHRLNACFSCGRTTHKSQDCPLNKKDPSTIIVKCFNCLSKGYNDTSHRANDKNCPCRQEYINIRSHVRHRNQLPASQTTAGNSFTYNIEHFPAAGSSSFPSNEQSAGTALYSNVAQSSSQSNELFNMDELLDIFQNAVEQLQRCSNKMQQMHVIVSLLKHAVK